MCKIICLIFTVLAIIPVVNNIVLTDLIAETLEEIQWGKKHDLSDWF